MDCKDCEQYNPENVCCSCKNLVYKKLRKENEILKNSLYNIGTYECPKCGYYSLLGFKCFNCGYDSTMRKDLDNDR